MLNHLYSFIPCTYYSLGLWVTRACAGSSVHGTGNQPCTGCPSQPGTSPTDTLIQIRQIQLWPWTSACTPLGCGRKLQHQEKTHTDLVKTCELLRDSGPTHELIFCSHLHGNKTILNKTSSVGRTAVCREMWRRTEEKLKKRTLNGLTTEFLVLLLTGSTTDGLVQLRKYFELPQCFFMEKH